MNPKLVELHAANFLGVTRQLAYEKHGGKELDLVLFVNGIPTATVELKNPLSGQNVQHAIHQYQADRDPRHPLFARQALFHFAVDPHLIYLTTRLGANDTRFLPFNLGSHGPGVDGSQGNPANPNGYDTDYLWRQVWAKNAWLDLLQRLALASRTRSPGSRTGCRNSSRRRRACKRMPRGSAPSRRSSTR